MNAEKIKSLFVTYDQFGIPEKVECRDADHKSIRRLDDAYMDYLADQRTGVLTYGRFPDLRVCRYDVDAQLLPDERLEMICNDAKSLQEFIAKNELTPHSNISLRTYDALFYALEGVDELDSLERLQHYMDPQTELPAETKEILDECLDYLASDTANQRIQAIETAQGVMLFYDRYDDFRRKSILQYFADHFFDPRIKPHAYVRMYEISRPSQEQIDIATKGGYMFSPYDQVFQPEKAVWSHLNIHFLDSKDTCKYDFAPTYHNYHYFTEDFNLDITDKNADIFNLVFIAEYGCPNGLFRDEQYNSFECRKDFALLDQQLTKARNEEPQNTNLFYRIQNQQQILARDILHEKYGVDIPKLELTGAVRPDSYMQKTSHKPAKKQVKRKI